LQFRVHRRDGAWAESSLEGSRRCQSDPTLHKQADGAHPPAGHETWGDQADARV
jgi:hypothetical protein